ncbi:MAG: hypothetical protein COA36_16650 [Desulfotalea sp.]|nr:MAG: hypothetical protein COA36_16650 [Desulfotalea sp.]
MRNPYDPEYQILDAANLASKSGRYVTDNPYVKVKNIKELQDFPAIDDTDFNEFLKHQQESSISSVCNAVFNKSDFIDRQLFYQYAQNKVNTETLPDGFVGYRLEVSLEKNVALEITRVLLDFEGTGDLKLLLFNTAKKEPIQSQTITITSSHQVEELTWVIDNTDGTYKGDYYLGYLTNDVDLGTLKPYKRDYDRSNVESVISCLWWEPTLFRGVTLEELPDLTTREGFDLATGLNPDISVYYDYTDMILQNQRLFGYAIYLDYCIKLISLSLSSDRSNKNQRSSEINVVRMLQEIDGQTTDKAVKITGLRPMLWGELKRLTKEIDSLKEGYFGGYIKIGTLT